jgi:hypothetical protein
MPRALPANLVTLLANPRVETHSTLDLIYSDTANTERHWATVPFTYGPTTYEAYLKRVGDIKQSISRAADRVKVELHNSDNVVCADVASGLRYFNYAEAIIGRHYSADNEVVEHLSELFRGRVMQPEVTESKVTFDIVDSLVAAGAIIAARPLSIKCPFRFKDPRTCAYAGVETTCNKMPQSDAGCRGRANEARFGGWYFPYPHTASAPTGTGGGGGSGGGTCFTGDTLVAMADGTYKPIRYVKPGDAVLCFFYDEKNKLEIVTTSIVDETFVHDVWEHFVFEFEDGSKLEVTEEHPLYVEKGAFYLAGYAKLKQKLASLSRNLYGSYGLEKKQIIGMRWNNEPYLTGKTVQVYNLHIRNHHTYFAGDIAVHNSKPPYDP